MTTSLFAKALARICGSKMEVSLNVFPAVHQLHSSFSKMDKHADQLAIPGSFTSIHQWEIRIALRHVPSR